MSVSLLIDLLDPLLLESIEKYNILKSKYSKVDPEIFDLIVSIDPTSIFKENKISKTGIYVDWILRTYLKLDKSQQSRFKEDAYKITDDLKIFEKSKSKLPQDQRDINKYDFSSLSNAVAPFVPKEKEKEQAKLNSKEVKVLYDGPDMFVGIPLTKEASIKLGRGTKWCTAADSSHNMFDEYNKQGNLIIIIDKHDPKLKYQLHFHSNQYMDKNDDEVELKSLFEWYPNLMEVVRPEFNTHLRLHYSDNPEADSDDIISEKGKSLTDDDILSILSTVGIPDFYINKIIETKGDALSDNDRQHMFRFSSNRLKLADRFIKLYKGYLTSSDIRNMQFYTIAVKERVYMIYKSLKLPMDQSEIIYNILQGSRDPELAVDTIIKIKGKSINNDDINNLIYFSTSPVEAVNKIMDLKGKDLDHTNIDTILRVAGNKDVVVDRILQLKGKSLSPDNIANMVRFGRSPSETLEKIKKVQSSTENPVKAVDKEKISENYMVYKKYYT